MKLKAKNIGSKEPATKGDLEDLREDIQADMTTALEGFKEDIYEELSNYATKKDMQEMKDEIIYEFKALAESIHVDVSSANKDEISLIKQKQGLHEKRLEKIENHVGIL